MGDGSGAQTTVSYLEDSAPSLQPDSSSDTQTVPQTSYAELVVGKEEDITLVCMRQTLRYRLSDPVSSAARTSGSVN